MQRFNVGEAVSNAKLTFGVMVLRMRRSPHGGRTREPLEWGIGHGDGAGIGGSSARRRMDGQIRRDGDGHGRNGCCSQWSAGPARLTRKLRRPSPAGTTRVTATSMGGRSLTCQPGGGHRFDGPIVTRSSSTSSLFWPPVDVPAGMGGAVHEPRGRGGRSASGPVAHRLTCRANARRRRLGDGTGPKTDERHGRKWAVTPKSMPTATSEADEVRSNGIGPGVDIRLSVRWTIPTG